MPDIPDQCDDGKTFCHHRASPAGCHSSWNGEGQCPDRKPFNSADFAYKDVDEFEEILGYKVNDTFKEGWRMARTTNSMLGISATRIPDKDETKEFLVSHLQWLSENWSLSPEGREYNAKFKKALDSILYCNVEDSQGNHCPETPAHIVIHNGKRTTLCEKCYQAWLNGTWKTKKD